MCKNIIFISLLLLIVKQSSAQFLLTGSVKNSTGVGIEGVAIKVKNTSQGTSTNKYGAFSLHFKNKGTKKLEFSHLEYNPKNKLIKIVNPNTKIEIQMEYNILMLQGIKVHTKQKTQTINSITIKSTAIKNISSPFNDISSILSSLPSVMSNNELSTSYSVRGGNYDENIIRVNGIQVYRPFLVKSGQQEGLSFINNDLIESVTFSAGGWDATNGGKMSSLLQANYRKTKSWHGGIKISLLGASGYLEGKLKDASFLIGIRHKKSKYLLNTLEIKAEYDPQFTDIQNYWNIPITNKISIESLFSFAANKYQVTPQNGKISFGTINQGLRFEINFDGQDQMFYNTLQEAIKVNLKLSQSLNLNVISSYMQTYETENGEVEGGYRLCDVDKNANSSTFNKCIKIRGVGTLYRYARNTLDANLFDFEINGSNQFNINNLAKFGIRYSIRDIRASLNEYSFIDYTGYTTILGAQSSKVNIPSKEFTIYAQHHYQGTEFGLTAGIYASQNSLNGKFYVSPRFLLNYSLNRNKNTQFKLSAGIYRQHPFYREILDINGLPTSNPTTQSSLQLVLGNNHQLTWWERNFTISTELFYKYLWNLIPYQFDNVHVEYYPNYTAKGYVVGFETRLAGEFIEGAESWFSFGLLSTKEQITNLDKKMMRRPTDQRLKIGAVFEDHIPNDPTLRVNLSIHYGSGLPIGPPSNLAQRNLFTGDSYTRVDITFSKIFLMKTPNWDNIRIGLGVYNLLGNKNAITYTWIQDFSGRNFAVPNNLTGRLFNLTFSTHF